MSLVLPETTKIGVDHHLPAAVLVIIVVAVLY